jgi:hypothetical protein
MTAGILSNDPRSKSLAPCHDNWTHMELFDGEEQEKNEKIHPHEIPIVDILWLIRRKVDRNLNDGL